MAASDSGSVQCVRLLLDGSARVNDQNKVSVVCFCMTYPFHVFE